MLLALAVATSLPGTGAAAVEEVSVQDSLFDPAGITVTPGTTVQWRHEGSLPHSVTADDGSFDSHPGCSTGGGLCMQNGQLFTHTFEELGAFRYYCRVHGGPGGSGMAGVVEVAPPTVPPTRVEALSATAGDSAIEVTGMATFGGETPVVVGTDGTGDAPVRTEMAALGLDATEIAIGRPDPEGGLEFVIRVTQLEGPPPPEVIRYLWQFLVGEDEFWVQAKTSDVTTLPMLPDDPQGAATNIPSFRLRGDCGPFMVGDVTVGTTCRHLRWLEGEFDAATNEIRLTVPLGDEAAPQFVPGATIDPAGGVTASIQAVASATQTSDQVGQDVPYVIPGPEVMLGIVPAGEPAAFTTPGTIAEDGSFAGSLSTGGLAPGEYDVWARACFGSNCDTGVTGVTL